MLGRPLQRLKYASAGRRSGRRDVFASSDNRDDHLLISSQSMANHMFQRGPIRGGKLVNIAANRIHDSSLGR
jgi:hypothetical protein